MKLQLTFILAAFFLLIACQPTPKHDGNPGEFLTADTIRYAQGFSIRYYQEYTSVEVRDPWDTTRLLQRYLLIDRTREKPANLPKGTVVKVPVRNIAVYTSVHAAIIDQLGEADKIIGVCEPRYMDTPTIQQGLQTGRVADLGEATSPNVEKMIENNTEIVIASPFQNSSYGPVEKIGIPIIEGADYMENTPLGRTEWIRFYGLLLGKAERADSIFRETETRYLHLKEMVSAVTERPTVITEKKFGASWYMPAGNSYIANMLRDAGANYLFSDLEGAGSVPLAFETVFEKAMHADFWLIKYNLDNELTYRELAAEYAPYKNFDAFTRQSVFGCNTGVVPYYEEFPLHPDLLLKDFILIFHPELIPNGKSRYYFRLPAEN